MKTIPLALFLAAVAASPAPLSASPPPANAPTTADSRAATAHLEVIETSAQGKTSTMRFALALVRDGAPVRARTSTQGVHHDVSLVWSARGSAGLVLDLGYEQKRPGHAPLNVSAQAPVPRGQRAVLADMTRGDGGSIVLAVTLR